MKSARFHDLCGYGHSPLTPKIFHALLIEELTAIVTLESEQKCFFDISTNDSPFCRSLSIERFLRSFLSSPVSPFLIMMQAEADLFDRCRCPRTLHSQYWIFIQSSACRGCRSFGIPVFHLFYWFRFTSILYCQDRCKRGCGQRRLVLLFL